jgi:thiol-disulfide isomerase/thioredoxin
MLTRTLLGSVFMVFAVTVGETLVVLGGEAPSPTSASPQPAAKKDEIQIEVIALDPLVEKIKTQRGKIVVVDTWATWCVPCKKEFPGLVKLHERHAKDGVVCMSVTVDKVKNQPEAKAFLEQVNARFPNYLTESTPWADKWEIKAIPVVLVFGRDGKLARKFDNDDPAHQFTYADVEKKVEELLQQGR